ncbi:MAG TPA: 2-amino-4-hydroxy-6-hydroxymethyldihydropteridine diphosphokinase [Polyangia bacterium]|nr:2-amino-4-hydroxy-6-hydroxymethyldihydropteridine diphosphokinase [Polyangia bacterium]
MTLYRVVRAYLAFGANLGDREGAIQESLARLSAAGVEVSACSPLYETDAVAPEPQPPYLNAVARVVTRLDPHALLALCLQIEAALGRVRPPQRPQASRLIDIDLLLYGDSVIQDAPSLLVPHPRLLERPFVRIPLADVAEPGLVHPVTGEPLDRAAPDAGVRVRWRGAS